MRIVPVQKLSINQIVYSPHHPVFRSTSQTTKMRAVFNSSVLSSNGSSLNDHLRIGPKLQTDLSMILLNWRTFEYVYSADIARMYRQILVNEKDLDYQRILWRSSTELPISEYQLLTVTYGTRSAPFLALRVLKQLAEDEGYAYPLGCSVLKNNIYIDDLLFGGTSECLARQTRDQVIALLQLGKFEPRKWASNHFSLISDIDPKDHGIAWTSPSVDTEGIKVLGLSWNPTSDQFYFNLQPIMIKSRTKRSFLSVLAQFHDPNGWVSPVIIRGKILMQQLWKTQCSWDDELPSEIVTQWENYFNSLVHLNYVKIPRWIHLSPNNADAQLHGFSDASEVAFGAVLYIRVISASGEVFTHLLKSKTKVAPIKQLSLPRLELQASVLLARLIASVRDAKFLSFNSIHCWTDSTIVLSWLKQHPSNWKTFVGNRVSEIQTLLPNCEWRHVPSVTNPADLSSRGIDAENLINSELWWKGPIWLSSDITDWPMLSEAQLCTDVEAKVHTHIMIDPPQNFMNDLATRYSSWKKLLRATVILTRFVYWIQNRNKIKFSKFISAKELNDAQITWFRFLQKTQFSAEIKALEKTLQLPTGSQLKSLNPFLDDKRIIRVGGRLEKSELPFESKHPVILKSHYAIKLLIKEIHERCFHGGLQLTLSIVRQSMWIIHPRPLIKSIIHHCLICTRDRAKKPTQLMANLPHHRVVKPIRAFTDCGLDYAGPMQVRMAGGRGHRAQSCYIAVFVCCAVKAVHLEVVTDYTSKAFIAAFRRFSSLRGQPKQLYSDCGTNFIGSNRELRQAFQMAIESSEFQNLIANDRIDWNFNPPAAPHFGGLWESAVKSMKIRLVKIFGNRTPTYEELVTAVYQISAIMNSRPLMPITDHVDDLNILTPGHFLIGGPFTSIPEPSLINLKQNQLNRWQQMQQLLEIFWKRWSTDYLQTLQQRNKWQNVEESVLLGQMVILRKPNLPPTKWLLGRITEIRKQSDNLVRVVKVKTATSEYLRPISELVLLPFHSNDTNDNSKSTDENNLTE